MKLFLLLLLLNFSNVSNCFSAEKSDVDFSIDGIQISGNLIFSSSEIEKVLEVSVGDIIERKKIVSSSENIQELYRLKGYDDAGVEIKLRSEPVAKTKIIDHFLDVKIREGLPTRISKIEYIFSKEKPVGEFNRLKERYNIKTGELFDQEVLERNFKNLEDDLGSLDFMGSKVELTEALTTAPPENSKIELPALKWVSLKVKVTVGERVTFGFSGNKILSHQDLNLLIDEQRLIGLSQDYIQRIKNQISDEYKKLGYDRVSIESYSFEGDSENKKKHVLFEINEGHQVQIENLQFDGQIHYNEADLETLFWNGTTGLTSRHYYIEKDLTKFAELLIEKMKSDGFLSAKLVSVNKQDSKHSNKVNVLITVYEGEQSRWDSIDFKGLSVFSADEVKSMLGVKEGEPLNLFKLNEGFDALKLAYRSRGYYESIIVNENSNDIVTYSQENRKAKLSIEFSEGTQSVVKKILIEGLSKTKVNVVERELLIKEGDVLEEAKWAESEARLRKLGIFSNVTIQAFWDPEGTGKKILRVKCEEGSPGLMAGGLGLRNDLGARAFGQFSYSNLFGKNHTLSLTTNANQRFGSFGSSFCASEREKAEDQLNGVKNDHCFVEFDTQLSYAFPYAIFGPTVFRPAISLEKKQLRLRKKDSDKFVFTNFDVSTIALTLTLERSLIKKPNLKGVLTYSLENTRQFNSDLEVDNQTLRIGSLIGSLILDLRDNSLSPTKGLYSTLSAELASPELLSQKNIPIKYTRFQFRSDYIFPLPQEGSAFISYRAGVIQNLTKVPDDAAEQDKAQYGLPLVKQFSLGGGGSIRGFQEQSISAPSNEAILGYSTFINYRAQVDFPFAGNLRFGPFWDAGAVRVNEFKFGNLRSGIGAGFRYRSPVGPVNFDLGFNVSPKSGEDSFRLHFSIGMI